MAEGGGAHSLLDHGSGSLNDSDAEHSLRKVENGGEEDGKDSEDKAEILKEAELADLEKEIEAGETHKEQDKTESLPRWTLSKVMNFVNNVIYGRYVNPRYLNILTDLADAEAFLIDGDSLLLELLAERSLDWSSGGQFLHLTYLFERFLQFFKDKDVVFHIIFFKDMQVIWSSEPSMLLARQAIILHLQHNTPFTVVTNIKNFWGPDWTVYVEQKSPAFLLLTDAEKIYWKIQPKKKKAVEFFFRTLLFRSLHMGLNCVFICGIELTNSKVMGFYTESSPVFMDTFRRDGLRDEVQRALQSSVQENCRVLASRLACARVMKKVADSPDFTQESKKSTEDGIKLFLLHTILLDKLPLKFRSYAVSNDCLEQFSLRTDGKVHPFREIQVSLWKVLKLLSKPYPFVASTENPLDMSVVSDIMDGRLILKLLSVTLERRSQGLEALSLPEAVIREAETVWKQVCDDVNKSQQSYAVGSHFLPLFAGDWTDFEPFEDESFKWEDSSKPRRLLDVKNDLVDVYSGDLKSKLNALAEGRIGEEPPNIGREFEERYHWHSLKPLSDDYDRTKSDEAQPPSDPRERFWFFKNKQQFASFQRFYGNSLEGSIDRAQIITVSNTGTEKKKEKSLPSKKAQQIIEENKEKHKEKEKKRDQERLTHFLKAVDQDLKNSNHDGALQLIDTFQASCNSPEFHLQALIKKLACCWDAWQDKRSCDSKSNDMTFPVLLMETVHKITDGFGHLLTVKDKKKLAQYMQKLGFADIASMFCELSADTGKKSENLSVHTTSARFQMELMGHLLKRDERSDRDPRVDHFIPDTWQRELLDAVDKKESAVIVAPTSSGKTFASYYCMENVLRESNEGVVVYVSPTKALVNQVAATIYARFSQKKLPEGRAVYGVFTRDYRHNTLNSQILVTVPQCLEILLLSPRRQDWAKNLKYVIFDEAHCLGQEGDGEVWEHLLLLIRCPFLALSATIGNPEGLRTWLQNAQDFRKQQDIQDNVQLRGSYRVRLVTYAERYSDLEKSIYLPSPKDGSFSEKSEKYESKYDVKRTEDFVRLHPCAQVGIKQLQENGFPGDMALTPKESLQLYDVMVAQWPDKESLLQLAPEKYFQQTKLIQKNDARLYENKVKKELKSWADDQHLEKVKNVISSLNSVCQEKMASTEEEWSEVDVFSTGYEFIMNNFVKLIEQLRAQEKLPALVFSFDRSMCEELSEKLTEEFERRENELKTNPGSKYFEKLKELEKKREQELKQAKKSKDKEKPSSRESADRTLCGIITQKNLVQHQMRDNKLKTNPGSKCFEKLEELEKKQKRDSKQGARCKEKPGARESMESQLEGQDKDDFSLLDKPLPECSLACTNVIGNDTLNKIMDRVHYLDETEVFKRALPRGISYHHSGLNAKERACVEMLFRQKYLQVVTATSTLALGIHMPCKTVVFAGDSPFLNSLMYRQMSGRAGRRGFDPVGNVVFFGLPYSKIQRLITANIPKLVGNFPISVSLVLRLLLMTSKGDDKKDALTKALTLLSHPFICQQEPHMGGQIKKHFLFSVEFLARLSLINLSGVPQEMAGLATHLHYHEPSNFVLVSFLQRGLFHRLCKPNESGQFSQDLMRKIVLVLSHLFGRRKLHPSFKRRIHLCPSSKVLLQDLPKQFADAVQEYNQQVTGVFKQYLTTVAAELKEDKGEENTLPLSGIVFQGQKDIGACEHDTISKLVRSSIPSSACSAFAALSGNSENRLHPVDRSRTSLFQGPTDNGGDEDDNEDDNKDEREDKDEKEHEDGNVDGSDTEDEESEEGFNFGTEQGDIDQPVPIGQLLKIVRQDVYTDMNIVPIFELEPRLNAYALDFFKHGSSKAILKENRLQSGEVFHLLKDFNLTIKSISCSLEELGPEKDNVVLAFKQLQEEYGEKFDKTYSRQ